VLVVNGFYYRFYRVSEALRAADPGARITECTARDLPVDVETVWGYDLIVLADMDATTWDAAGRARLAGFVEAGGRLVVLGGPFTLGQGFFAGSHLERVLPATFRVARDVYALPEPLALAAARGARALRGRPLVYYYHAVLPRENAAKRLWAGPVPLWLDAKCGHGSAAVFAGTMLGTPSDEGQTPFWAWDGWPALLGGLMVGAD
jgi:hypothetical protein